MIVFLLRDAKSVRRSHREEGGVADEIEGVGIDALSDIMVVRTAIVERGYGWRDNFQR